MDKNLFLFLTGLLLCSCTVKQTETISVPYIKGESRTVIEAKPDTAKQTRWFTNDHCFVTDKDGVIHCFAINNPYPPEGKELYRYHPYLGHFTSMDMKSGWKRQDFAINEEAGTEYIGAPYVVCHEESGRWIMVVETWRDVRRLEVYESQDLFKWNPTKVQILPDKLWVGTRDPHIMKGDDGKYWIHVVSTGNKGTKQSQVLRIRTKDFINFDEPETIMGINDCEWATLIESPFLYKKDNLWYLFFTYAHRRYAETLVVVSDNPNHFDYEKNTIATLFGHAAEVYDFKGKTYITSCGPEDEHFLNTHGITMAELQWSK